MIVSLTCHPDTPAKAISAIACSIVWQEAGQWCIDYIVAEPPEALRLPMPIVPVRADGLWQDTCFELFLRAQDGDRYFEFNFSPSGEWAAYRFDRYREGMIPLDIAAPRVTSTDPHQFAISMKHYLTGRGLDADSVQTMMDAENSLENATQYGLSVSVDDPGFGGPGQWSAAISAVIEEADGTKSFWALHHPPGKPDFHHPDCFVLELPAPVGR